MAAVIDFLGRRANARGHLRHSAPTIDKPLPESQRYVVKFNPPKPSKTNSRNRYDAAFKGAMTKRARELCWELEFSLSTSHRRDAMTRDAQIRWVIEQIKAIEAEVLRTTPEHHRPVEAETPTHAAVTNGEAVWWPR